MKNFRRPERQRHAKRGDGNCKICGRKTHKASRLPFGSGKLEPLTVEGRVVDGRCLRCHPPPAPRPQLRVVPDAIGCEDDNMTSVSEITMDTPLALVPDSRRAAARRPTLSSHPEAVAEETDPAPENRTRERESAGEERRATRGGSGSRRERRLPDGGGEDRYLSPSGHRISDSRHGISDSRHSTSDSRHGISESRHSATHDDSSDHIGVHRQKFHPLSKVAADFSASEKSIDDLDEIQTRVLLHCPFTESEDQSSDSCLRNQHFHPLSMKVIDDVTEESTTELNYNDSQSKAIAGGGDHMRPSPVMKAPCNDESERPPSPRPKENRFSLNSLKSISFKSNGGKDASSENRSKDLHLRKDGNRFSLTRLGASERKLGADAKAEERQRRRSTVSSMPDVQELGALKFQDSVAILKEAAAEANEEGPREEGGAAFSPVDVTPNGGLMSLRTTHASGCRTSDENLDTNIHSNSSSLAKHESKEKSLGAEANFNEKQRRRSSLPGLSSTSDLQAELSALKQQDSVAILRDAAAEVNGEGLHVEADAQRRQSMPMLSISEMPDLQAELSALKQQDSAAILRDAAAEANGEGFDAVVDVQRRRSTISCMSSISDMQAELGMSSISDMQAELDALKQQDSVAMLRDTSAEANGEGLDAEVSASFGPVDRKQGKTRASRCLGSDKQLETSVRSSTSGLSQHESMEKSLGVDTDPDDRQRQRRRSTLSSTSGSQAESRTLMEQDSAAKLREAAAEANAEDLDAEPDTLMMKEIVSALESNERPSVHVYAASFGTLENLAQEPTNHSLMVDLGVVSILREGIYRHDSSVDILSAACTVLANLSISRDMRGCIVSQGGVTALFLAMKSTSATSKVQSDALKALYNLCESSDGKKSVVAGLRIIIASFFDHEDVKHIQHATCLIFCQLSVDEKCRKSMIMFSQLLDVLAKIMKLNGKDQSIQEAACSTLRYLSLEESVIPKLLSKGFVPLVIDAMDHSSDDSEELQESACTFLMNMGSSPEASVVICQLQGIQQIVKSMQVMPTSVRLSQASCGALRAITKGDTHKNIAISAGAVDSVICLLVVHQAEIKVLESAVNVLTRLVSLKKAPKVIADAGGVFTVTETMKFNSSSTGLIIRGSRFIQNIALSNNGEYANEALGGISPILKCMNEHPENAKLVEESCKALRCLVLKSEICKDQVIDAGGVAVIEKTMEENNNSQRWQTLLLDELFQ